MSSNIPYMSRDDDQFDDSWIAGIALPLAFFCRSCRGRAQMVEADGALDRVECLTCGIALEGRDVQDMHEHLLNPLSEQEGADILRQIADGKGLSGASTIQVGDEVSDPRWPFVLMVEPDDEGID